MKTIAMETDTQINADFADIVLSIGNHKLTGGYFKRSSQVDMSNTILKYTNASCTPLYYIASNMLFLPNKQYRSFCID